MSEPFTARVRSLKELAVIDMHGMIDRSATQGLETAFDEALTQDTGQNAGQAAKPILLNFQHVEYINSVGIALIVSLLARARRERRQLLACGLTEHYRHIFEIIRLAEFIRIFPDEKDALAAIGLTPEENENLFSSADK